MNINDEKLEKLTGKLLKKTGIEEPSTFFTERVMQSVNAVQQPVVKTKTIFYFWFLLTIPVFIAGGWYLSTYTEILNKFLKVLNSIGLYLNSVFSGMANSFHQLGNISFSPIVLIGSLAVLALLVIETILTRKKYQL